MNVLEEILLCSMICTVASCLSSLEAKPCLYILNTTTGSIFSPLYPTHVYKPHTKCVWRIPSPLLSQTKFVFSAFDIQEGSQGTTDCNTDRLEFWNVYDSPVFDSPKLIGSYCGNTAPDVSSDWKASAVEIVFHTDFEVEKTGFALNYYPERNKCAFTDGNCQHGCVNAQFRPSCVCTGSFTIDSMGQICQSKRSFNTPMVYSLYQYEMAKDYDYFNSPNYYTNDHYEKFDTADWIITTVPGYRINITFSSFKTATLDHLTIYDGSLDSDTVLGDFSGTKVPPLLQSSSNKIYMKFIAADITTAAGFSGKYVSTCGGTFLAEYREKYIFSHPKFGYNNYTGPIDNCHFYIEAPAGSSIMMSFIYFDVSDTTPLCEYNQVSVYEGANSTYPKVGTYCSGASPPPVLHTKDAAASVYFSVKNKTGTGEGFSLVYRAVPN